MPRFRRHRLQSDRLQCLQQNRKRPAGGFRGALRFRGRLREAVPTQQPPRGGSPTEALARLDRRRRREPGRTFPFMPKPTLAAADLSCWKPSGASPSPRGPAQRADADRQARPRPPRSPRSRCGSRPAASTRARISAPGCRTTSSTCCSRARPAGRAGKSRPSVQAHGGYINAYTTFDRTVYYIDLPSEHAAVAVDLLADAVLHSTPAGRRGRQGEGRDPARDRDDPGRSGRPAVGDAFSRRPFASIPTGIRSSATARSFPAVTRDDLAGLLPGPVRAEQPRGGDRRGRRCGGRRRRSRSISARRPAPGWPRSSCRPSPAQLGPREQHRFEDVEVARAIVAWQIPGPHPSRRPGARRAGAGARATGTARSSGRNCGRKPRSSTRSTPRAGIPARAGCSASRSPAEPTKRARPRRRWSGSWARCAAAGFTAAQLKKALRQMVAGEISIRQTMSGQASRLGAAEVVAGDLGYSRRYFERLALGPAGGPPAGAAPAIWSRSAGRRSRSIRRPPLRAPRPR